MCTRAMRNVHSRSKPPQSTDERETNAYTIQRSSAITLHMVQFSSSPVTDHMQTLRDAEEKNEMKIKTGIERK